MATTWVIVEDQDGTSLRTHKLTGVDNTMLTLETGDFDIVSIDVTAAAHSDGYDSSAGGGLADTNTVFLKFWNKADVTLGTDHPTMQLPVEASTSWHMTSKTGIRDVFTAAITFLATKEADNTQSSHAAADQPLTIVNIGVKPSS